MPMLFKPRKPKRVDLRGKRFGRLVVLEKAGKKNGCVFWKCLCDCGNTKKVTTGNLTTTFSCGCLKKEMMTTHGLARHPLFFVWKNILRRAETTEGPYANVGVCKAWEDVRAFIKYVEENLGSKPSKLYSIDRINNLGNYEPGNIRWATKEEQSNNRRYVNIVTYVGETGTLRFFAQKYGINFNTIRTRFRRGIPLCQPLRK